MCVKVLRIIALLFFYSHFVIKTIDPFSLIAGPVVKESFDYAKGYWYSDQDKQRRMLKKYLYSDTSHSAILYGCNENFTEHCAKLARYFALMEDYNAKSSKFRPA